VDSLRSYTIDGDLCDGDSGAVEVTITLEDERRRWCFFMTPHALQTAGDFVDGTEVRLHIGERHMIIVSELSRDIIERALRHLADNGFLERHTLPVSGKDDGAG